MTQFFFKIKKKKVKLVEKTEITKSSMNAPSGAGGSNTWIENGIIPKIRYPKVIFNLQTISKWPENTNLSCWNCTRSFSGMPIGIPYHQINGVYYLKGCFCGFKCANTYNYKEETEGKWKQENMLISMYFEFGNTKLPIGFAPKKELLITYGGPYSNEEYDILLENEYIIKIIYPPIISISPSVSLIPINDLTKKEKNGLETSKVETPSYRFSRECRLDSE